MSGPELAVTALSGDGHILEVGDQVIARKFSRNWPGTVVALEDGMAAVVWAPAQGQKVAGIVLVELELLTRMGGPILIGDFVRVNGAVLGYGARDHMAVDWLAMVVGRFGTDTLYIAPLHRSALFETSHGVVTRITRAEALA